MSYRFHDESVDFGPSVGQRISAPLAGVLNQVVAAKLGQPAAELILLFSEVGRSRTKSAALSR